MRLWVDAQISPHLAPWLTEQFGVEAFSVRSLGLRDARDSEIFRSARLEGTIVLTKDRDFVRLLERHGPPPQILWLTAGNTSNHALKQLFGEVFSDALELVRQGEPLVEIRSGA